MSSYTREELNALPEKILQEFLDKKSKCIGFNVFEAAANGKKNLVYSDWFFFCKKCEVQFIDSILPLIKNKETMYIEKLTDLVKEMFPDCDIELKFTGMNPPEEADEYYYKNYRLHISWK